MAAIQPLVLFREDARCRRCVVATVMAGRQPSRRSGRSAAWPSGKMVLTKMPMLPRGESIPPTTLKPRPFFPGPFSNSTL